MFTVFTVHALVNNKRFLSEQIFLYLWERGQGLGSLELID
jgi:hypothetical protein